MDDVNVTNVLTVPPDKLAMWVRDNLLNVRLPIPGANHTLNPQTDIVPILPDIANRIVIATELYIIVVGAKPAWTIEKRTGDKDKAADAITVLSANVDLLHRTIQSLNTVYEAASRMMTGLSVPSRFNAQSF
jgi:hypothetical protein